jgi:hypothetical protein
MANRKRIIRSKKTKPSKIVRSRSSRTPNPQTLAEYLAMTDRLKERPGIALNTSFRKCEARASPFRELHDISASVRKL